MALCSINKLSFKYPHDGIGKGGFHGKNRAMTDDDDYQL